MLKAFLRKLHPTSKINFFPRIIAAHGCLLFTWFIVDDKLFTFPSVTILIIGLAWPVICLWLASFRGTKGAEILNMHGDVVLTGCICLIAPNYLVIFAIVTVLTANAIFTGSFRLFLSSALVFCTVQFLGFQVFGIEMIDITRSNRYIIMGYMLVYFSAFSFLGYNLIKNFLKLNKRVRKLSITDPLTHCFNRHHLDKELDKEVYHSLKREQPLTVVFADIDHFKSINDTHGHHVGDEILKTFTKILVNNVREEFDWVARFGGEEFVLVLNNTNKQLGFKITERIRLEIEEQDFQIGDQHLKLTSSFGLTTLDNYDIDVLGSDLLSSADKALYSAKQNGRNRTEVNSELKGISAPPENAMSVTAS